MNKVCCVNTSENNYLASTVEFLKIIAEKNRLKILCILSEQEQCVYDIWKYLNLSQNLTSHHLKVLKDFGLISSRKEGLNVFYSIDNDNLAKSKKLLNEFLSAQRKAC